MANFLTASVYDCLLRDVGFGFNPGSALLLGNENIGNAAATAAVSTALAGSAGGICALFTNLYIEERRTGEPHFSLAMAMNGALSGLVAITAPCGVIEVSFDLHITYMLFVAYMSVCTLNSHRLNPLATITCDICSLSPGLQS